LSEGLPCCAHAATDKLNTANTNNREVILNILPAQAIDCTG